MTTKVLQHHHAMRLVTVVADKPKDPVVDWLFLNDHSNGKQRFRDSLVACTHRCEILAPTTNTLLHVTPSLYDDLQTLLDRGVFVCVTLAQVSPQFAVLRPESTKYSEDAQKHINELANLKIQLGVIDFPLYNSVYVFDDQVIVLSHHFHRPSLDFPAMFFGKGREAELLQAPFLQDIEDIKSSDKYQLITPNPSSPALTIENLVEFHGRHGSEGFVVLSGRSEHHFCDAKDALEFAWQASGDQVRFISLETTLLEKEDSGEVICAIGPSEFEALKALKPTCKFIYVEKKSRRPSQADHGTDKTYWKVGLEQPELNDFEWKSVLRSINFIGTVEELACAASEALQTGQTLTRYQRLLILCAIADAQARLPETSQFLTEAIDLVTHRSDMLPHGTIEEVISNFCSAQNQPLRRPRLKHTLSEREDVYSHKIRALVDRIQGELDKAEIGEYTITVCTEEQVQVEVCTKDFMLVQSIFQDTDCICVVKCDNGALIDLRLESQSNNWTFVVPHFQGTMGGFLNVRAGAIFQHYFMTAAHCFKQKKDQVPDCEKYFLGSHRQCMQCVSKHANWATFQKPSEIKVKDGTLEISLNRTTFVLEKGQDIFKYGETTGLTCGIFQEVVTPGRAQMPAVLVQNPFPESFSCPGDSGALYFVLWRPETRQPAKFVPVALHTSTKRFHGQLVGVGLLLTQCVQHMFKDADWQFCVSHVHDISCQ